MSEYRNKTLNIIKYDLGVNRIFNFMQTFQVAKNTSYENETLPKRIKRSKFNSLHFYPSLPHFHSCQIKWRQL